MADILVGRGVRRPAPTLFDLITGPATSAQSALGAMGSAAKGAAQATVGLPGDIESLVRMITGGEQKLPTTEQVGQFVNQYIRAPYPQYERLGEFTGLPVAGALNRPVTQLTNEAADALVRAITGNPQATAPQVIRETSMPFMNAIVPRDVAASLKMPVTLPTDETFTKAVQNTPGAQITNEGLLMRIQRSQKPEQAGEESVRTGVFYLPEGSASAKYYKQGKSSEAVYGGSENIAGETLYKNPMFVKGATGGKAPEAAYDELMGKGAYQKMRKDVLSSYKIDANQSQKIEGIQEILQKYNGLDSDDAYNMAYNIVSNSKSGNTLPYAVQENIVANAIRNAGHDSVLGFSKKRTGDPFISEVFDVREATYPTREGGFSLMPQFQSLLD